MLYMAIFIIILLFIVITMLKINIVIEFLKDDKDDHFTISAFTMGGILKYKYEMPLFSINNEGIKMRIIKERGKHEKKMGDKSKEFRFKDILKWFKYARYIYRKNYSVISNINTYATKKFVVEDIRLNILLGVGEAHYTAILSGALWAICGSALSILCSKVKVKNKNIAINSNFSELKILIDFYCIFNFKIVHIIVMAIKLLFFYIRGKLNIKIKTVGGGFSG